MSLRSVRSLWLFGFLFTVHVALGQKTRAPSGLETSESSRSDPEAKELVSDILSQIPAKETSLGGVLKIRDAAGKRSQVPLTYRIVPEPGGWRGIYEARSTPWRGAERLIIVHHDNQPNQYIHSPAGRPGEAPGPAVALSGEEAAVPFAGSDYWLSDLGMEFLHWPEQRLVRDAKIKMRQSRPCKVIESTNPTASAAGMARVISWLDSESGAPIYAEGFDAGGHRIKTFSLHGLTKANGHWQPKDLEMLTEKTDSKTQIEFSVEPQ